LDPGLRHDDQDRPCCLTPSRSPRRGTGAARQGS
jgi:hypothetical protein